jgi:hypothetical protein
MHTIWAGGQAAPLSGCRRSPIAYRLQCEVPRIVPEVPALTALKLEIEHDFHVPRPRVTTGPIPRVSPARPQPRRSSVASPGQTAELGRGVPRAAGRWRVRRATPAHPMRRALLYTGFPAFLLVLYVALWTGAMRAGYHKQQISDRIAQLRIENDSLQAEMRRLQWPHRIYQLATRLGMQRADQIDFVHVTGTQASGVREHRP